MTKMVRIGAGLLVAGLAFSTFTGSAHAADLGGYERMPSIKDRAPEYRPSIWSGFYIGANIGGGAGTVSSKDASDTIGAGGALGGVHGGYNWQRGNFVFGAEADFDVSGMRGSKTYSDGDVAAHIRNLGSIRGRLGYSVGSTLFYGTAGLAYGQINSVVAESVQGRTQTTTFNHSQTGYAVGAGMESPLGLFGPSWTVKVEYLYVDLGRSTDSFADAVLSPSTDIFTTRMQEHVFRTGINYHINAPVVARY